MDEDGGVGFELEGYDHAFGRPAIDEVFEEFGNGVEVDDEALAARNCRRRVEIVEGLFVL